MAKPIAPETLEADRASLVAVNNMQDYTALNPSYTKEALSALEEERKRAKEAALHTRNAATAARAALIAIDRTYHATMIGVRLNVKAQYGPDSPEVQAVGLKKQSDRKRPTRRRVTPASTEG